MPVFRQNQIISALPRKDKQHFLGRCERTELIHNEVLSKPGDPIRYAYFPIDCSISLVNLQAATAGMEIALVGNEGMLGIPLVLGIDVSSLYARVQVDGAVLRMNAAILRRELQLSPGLMRTLKRYIHVRGDQLAQLAICNRYHVVEARLARRILMTLDRSNSYDLQLTHEQLALMLGVRRAGITKAAVSLQNRKLIHYKRGVITVPNKRRLEAAACGCYRADKRTYEQIMP